MITMEQVEQCKRVKASWEAISGGELRVEEIKGTFYAYGSELQCLRLDRAYRKSGDKARMDYSVNLDTWFFRLET